MAGYLHDEEDHEGKQEGRLQILEARRIQGDDQRQDEDDALVRQLADGNVPRVVLKAEVQDNLRYDGVDGTVEDPSFDGKSEVGEGKVLVRPEEDVGDEAIGTTLPL